MKLQWTKAAERLPVPMQPVWVADVAHRGNIALAIYYGPQKGFVFVGEDTPEPLDVTHWIGVRWPGAVPKKRKTQLGATVSAHQLSPMAGEVLVA